MSDDKPKMFEILASAREAIEFGIKHKCPINPVDSYASDIVEICEAYERLQAELAKAKMAAFQWEAECGHALGRNGMRLLQERDELKAEVERLKDRCEKLRVGHEAMSSNDQMTFGHLYIETERLKLLAENYSAILQKLVDRHWFDGTQIENHYLACSLCDCGNSGEKINTDGHDYDCAISLARQALAEKERE